MLYGMYISAAGALANSYRQDVIANNLANVETVAFKPELALFQARRTEAQETGQSHHTSSLLEGMGGGVFALPTATDFSPASIDVTGNPYDVALAGKGFFQVLKDSQILYTRDGRFTHDENNQLVTATGKLPVLDDSGEPIIINPALGNLVVDESGLISQDVGPIARLGIVDFDDPKVLRKLGNNLYQADDTAQPQRARTVVHQNALENSGVNPLDQLTEMIRTQRLFQSNVTMMQIQDQTLGQAVSQLGKING